MTNEDITPQHVAWRIFLMSHSVLTKKVSIALEEKGCISFDTYDVLVALSEASGHSMKMGDLADATFFSNSGISRRVGRLEKAGLISRVKSDNDGRVFYATLTTDGKRALRKAWKVYRKVIDDLFADVISSREAGMMTETFRSVLRPIDLGILERWVEQDRTDAPLL